MIELYSSENCIWCRKTKSYLDSKGVSFRTKNISDPDNARRIYELTGQKTVPITVVGKTAVVGYDPPALDRIIDPIENAKT